MHSTGRSNHKGKKHDTTFIRRLIERKFKVTISHTNTNYIFNINVNSQIVYTFKVIQLHPNKLPNPKWDTNLTK